MKRNVMVGIAVTAAITIGAVATAVATGGNGGSNTSKGIPPGPGASSSGPTSTDGATGGGSGGTGAATGTPQVPHNSVAAIYNVFGLVSGDIELLDGIQQRLENEGYVVTPYVDKTEGAGGHGGATLANFVGMARRASVIIINAHGEDWSGASQTCSLTGKGISPCGTVGNPTRAPTPPPPAATRQPQVPDLQVEWYPSWKAEQAALKRYLAQGYDRSWLYDPFPGSVYLSTLIPARTGDWAYLRSGKYDMSVGLRPWLGITAKGIAHFFSGHEVDFVDNLACHSMAFASAFDSRSYFGHANLGCVDYEYHDEPILFDRLIGKSGVAARTTTEAFGLGDFNDSFFKLAAKQPVVLSPAVESIDPPDTARVVAGETTTLTVKFDAAMETSSANDIVTVSGCGATLGNPQWKGTDTITVDLTVPKKPPNTTATLTVHQQQARAPGDGDNQFLDGNTDPAASGLAPNRDDFTSTLSCDTFSTPPPPSTTAPPGRCNPGDVELRIHIYGHADVDMTYTEPGSTTAQTSWPAGNAPFPNSFPKYPAPYLRYGCFLAGTPVHLTFRNWDEPWTLYSKTTGPTPTGGGVAGGCNISRKLQVGMPFSAQLSTSRSCDVVMTDNTDLNAYWVDPSYVNGALAGWAQYPSCLPNSPPHYCPPGS